MHWQAKSMSNVVAFNKPAHSEESLLGYSLEDLRAECLQSSRQLLQGAMILEALAAQQKRATPTALLAELKSTAMAFLHVDVRLPGAAQLAAALQRRIETLKRAIEVW